MELKTIKVYRYLFGPAGRGFTDEELAKSGIFCFNQFNRYHQNDPEYYKQYPKLNVFLAKEAVAGRMAGRHFPINPPALAEAVLPYGLLFGAEAKLSLVSNSVTGRVLFEVTEQMVSEFELDNQKIGNEYWIEPREGVEVDDFVSTIRGYERLYRPILIDPERGVRPEAGFKMVDMGELVEGSIHLEGEAVS